MDNFSITQFGKPLKESLYTIDKENKIFYSKEYNLELDFKNSYGWTFTIDGGGTLITGGSCTIKTRGDYTFDTGNHCTFNTGADCTFKTEEYCTFNTGNRCTFDTGLDCTFYSGNDCTFNTGTGCTFKIDWDCTFTTGESCVFSLNDFHTHNFKSYDEHSIILDRIDKKRYILTKEFIAWQKIKNG